MDALSSLKIVKLVFLRKPDAEPKKGIRIYRVIRCAWKRRKSPRLGKTSHGRSQQDTPGLTEEATPGEINTGSQSSQRCMQARRRVCGHAGTCSGASCFVSCCVSWSWPLYPRRPQIVLSSSREFTTELSMGSREEEERDVFHGRSGVDGHVGDDFCVFCVYLLPRWFEMVSTQFDLRAVL